MTETMKLVTKPGCPFAERTRVVLAWLELDHVVVEIDVENKPDWFKALSPLGKVPLLLHKGEALFESTAINEYLIECFGLDSGLIPKDPVERAKMRAWIQFDETALVPAFYRLFQTADEFVPQRRSAFLARLRVLAEHLGRNGPFILGTSPSLADISLHTHMSRVPVLEAERGLVLGEEFAALETWRAAMMKLPVVRQTTISFAEMNEDLAPYIANIASGSTARDMVGPKVA